MSSNVVTTTTVDKRDVVVVTGRETNENIQGKELHNMTLLCFRLQLSIQV